MLQIKNWTMKVHEIGWLSNRSPRIYLLLFSLKLERFGVLSKGLLCKRMKVNTKIKYISKHSSVINF